MEKKNLVSMEQGIEAIMGIIGDSEVVVGVETLISPKPQETVYDGRGHAVSVNGKKTTTGYVKGAKKVKNPKDSIREDIFEAAFALLSRVKAFEGKTGKNKQEGIVIRLTDADYTVKITGHAKPEYADRDEDFVAEKNYATRGKEVNHAAAIAKVLVGEIENENSDFKIENQNLVTLLSAKASMVRFEVAGNEYSFKITKKRTRVVMS